jgi:hypothetical protein
VRAALVLALAAGCAHAPRPQPVDNAERAPTEPAPPAPKVFVDLDPRDGPLHGALVDAITADPVFTVTIDERLPGFHVGATATHDIQKLGRGIMVTCTVSVIMATYPSKSMFALLNGVASVPAERDVALIARAADECIAAVVSDLVENKVRPELLRKAGLDGVSSPR